MEGGGNPSRSRKNGQKFYMNINWEPYLLKKTPKGENIFIRYTGNPSYTGGWDQKPKKKNGKKKGHERQGCGVPQTGKLGLSKARRKKRVGGREIRTCHSTDQSSWKSLPEGPFKAKHQKWDEEVGCKCTTGVQGGKKNTFLEAGEGRKPDPP